MQNGKLFNADNATHNLLFDLRLRELSLLVALDLHFDEITNGIKDELVVQVKVFLELTRTQIPTY